MSFSKGRLKLGQTSPYGKGLGRIAPPGMQPKGLRIDRWQGWQPGTADREVGVPDETDDHQDQDSDQWVASIAHPLSPVKQKTYSTFRLHRRDVRALLRARKRRRFAAPASSQ